MTEDRYMAISIDKRTGTHQILTLPCADAECVRAFQMMGPVEPHRHRLCLLVHPNAPKE